MTEKTGHPAERFCIILGTCRAYADVVKLWHRATEKYWPEAASKAILCTDHDPVLEAFPPARVHAHGTGWCAGLIACLESIDDEFVVFLLDDYIVEAPVDHGLVGKLVDQMRADPTLGVIYLTDTGLAATAQSRLGLFEIDRGPYSVNSCPGLWRRSFLIETLRPFRDPWAWEAFAFGTPVAKAFRTACWGPSLYSYSFKTGGLIYRGAISRAALARIAPPEVLGVDPTELPGFSLEAEGAAAKRTLGWKLRFLRTGFAVSPSASVSFLRMGLLARFNRLKRKSG